MWVGFCGLCLGKGTARFPCANCGEPPAGGVLGAAPWRAPNGHSRSCITQAKRARRMGGGGDDGGGYKTTIQTRPIRVMMMMMMMVMN